jgi:hypothetical protein
MSHDPLACRDANCPKNHIHYKKVHGKHKAELVLVHFKNDNIKGAQHIPLANKMVEMFLLLEQAILNMFPKSSTLFHMGNGNPFQDAYFSTVVGDWLTFVGVRTTANWWRHSFTTLWRDFLSSPTTQLLDYTVQQLEEGAAQFMLNSTNAWNAAYDDTDGCRAILHTLALWDNFAEFVHNTHLLSEEEWDPLTTPYDELVFE